MGKREALGVLDGESLAFGVARIRAPRFDVGEVVFGERIRRALGLAPLLADRAVVDLCDAHARQLALADREDALLVDRVTQRARADAHLGSQLPHADFGVASALGDLDARHRKYSSISCGFDLRLA